MSHGIGALGIGVILGGEFVGEEEKFEYQEYDSQFDENNKPQSAPDGH